jgi:hypothetical protein
MGLFERLGNALDLAGPIQPPSLTQHQTCECDHSQY